MSHCIEVLSPEHDCRAFACGNDWLDDYLRKHAIANQKNGYARVYVAVNSESKRIDGYFSISMGGVRFEHLTPELQRNMPKYPMPVCHLGCLAVQSDCQGKGLGEMLLVRACMKMVEAADIIGARAIEVKAVDGKAKQWYEQYGFVSFADAPLHLYLPMSTAQDLLRSMGLVK